MSVRNAPAPDWRRRTFAGRIRSVLVLGGSLILLSDCGPSWPPRIPPDPDTKQTEALLKGDFLGDLRRDTLIDVKLRQVEIQLASLPWHVPEYHDEQRLWDPTTSTYGPMANVFVQPYFGSFHDIGQINTAQDSAVLAAIVWVDKPTAMESLTSPYQKLGLIPELNCVYLKHSGTDVMQGWVAQVVAGVNGVGCPRPNAAASPHTLEVQALKLDYNNWAAYPPVARFEEVGGETLIGVKCLNRWCMIGPHVTVPVAPHLLEPGALSTRAWRVNGWYDAQTISAKNEAGAVVGRIRATIIPADNLETLTTTDYAAGWTPVATIWLEDAPPASSVFAKRWRLKEKFNQLSLRYFPLAPPNQQWVARLQGPNGAYTNLSIPVSRHEHYDVLVPGTARWRFVFTDEIIWVRCDQGCCQVDATNAT